MQESPGADRLRNEFYKKGCTEATLTYNHWAAFYDTIFIPFFLWTPTLAAPVLAPLIILSGTPPPLYSTAFQVGGFEGTAKNDGGGTVTYRIINKAGWHSFAAGDFGTGTQDSPSPNGPWRTIHQTFEWTEHFDACRCKSKK